MLGTTLILTSSIIKNSSRVLVTLLRNVHTKTGCELLWHDKEYQINPQNGDIFNSKGKQVPVHVTKKQHKRKVRINEKLHDHGTIVWEHCNQSLLPGHLDVVQKDGNASNVGIDNLDVEYSQSCLSTTGDLLLPKFYETNLDGYERLSVGSYAYGNNHYLVNPKKGCIINAETKLPVGDVTAQDNIRIYLGFCDGKRTYQSKSRLIYEHVHGKIEPKHHIHHKDGNLFNDRIDNLEKIPHKDHCRHTYQEKSLLPPKFRKPKPIVASEISASIDSSQILRFPSCYSAEQTLKLCPGTVSKICNGKTYKTTSKVTNKTWTFSHEIGVNYSIFEQVT